MAIISSQKKKKKKKEKEKVMAITIMVMIGKEINRREIYGLVRKRKTEGKKEKKKRGNNQSLLL